MITLQEQDLLALAHRAGQWRKLGEKNKPSYVGKTESGEGESDFELTVYSSVVDGFQLYLGRYAERDDIMDFVEKYRLFGNSIDRRIFFDIGDRSLKDLYLEIEENESLG